MKLIKLVMFLWAPALCHSQIKVNISPSSGAPCIPVVTSYRTLTPSYQAPRSTNYIAPNNTYYAPRRITTVRSPRNKRAPLMRTFKSKDGSSLRAKLLSISSKSKTAKIKTDKGKLYNVPISRFSDSDISYMKNWWNHKNKK
jgi:hypothetical protein